ncbi:translesion DNA synthesis-associated protein ImuA [Pollutimonas sp. H1-120]|uniref:translesion DNA synthesis-associated protein ImuA n=1 Tax=Pollutimonas sp. H1-120 TaxID=3148824 RepID=UPI003B51F3F7
MQHPEHIHPALWRGTQLAHARRPVVSTGFAALDRELPGQGWPLGSLIEFLPSQPGIGEIHLLRPALANLSSERSVILVHPPCEPYFHCWVDWRLQSRRLLWVNPKTQGDALWAAEQILKHNACAALLCWAATPQPDGVRRLHLVAQQSDTLFVLLRPQTAAMHASAAPLRLRLTPFSQGIGAFILKRRGPSCNQPVSLVFQPARNTAGCLECHEQHASLVQPASAHAQSGRPLPALVG